MYDHTLCIRHTISEYLLFKVQSDSELNINTALKDKPLQKRDDKVYPEQLRDNALLLDNNVWTTNREPAQNRFERTRNSISALN